MRRWPRRHRECPPRPGARGPSPSPAPDGALSVLERPKTTSRWTIPPRRPCLGRRSAYTIPSGIGQGQPKLPRATPAAHATHSPLPSLPQRRPASLAAPVLGGRGRDKRRGTTTAASLLSRSPGQDVAATLRRACARARAATVGPDRPGLPVQYCTVRYRAIRRRTGLWYRWYAGLVVVAYALPPPGHSTVRPSLNEPLAGGRSADGRSSHGPVGTLPSDENSDGAARRGTVYGRFNLWRPCDSSPSLRLPRRPVRL